MTKNLELFELFIVNLPKFRKIHIVDILTQSQLQDFSPFFFLERTSKTCNKCQSRNKKSTICIELYFYLFIFSVLKDKRSNFEGFYFFDRFYLKIDTFPTLTAILPIIDFVFQVIWIAHTSEQTTLTLGI